MTAYKHMETLPQKIVIWELTLTTLKQEISKMYVQPNPNPIALEVAKQVQIHIVKKSKHLNPTNKSWREKPFK